MAVKLPPLGDRPRGSRVWQGDALHPIPRPLGAELLGRHAAWLRSYRRSATGLAARRSGMTPCRLYSTDRHSATGLMARYKGQRDLDFTLAFCAAKNTQATSKHLNPQGGASCGKKKISPFIHAAKSPNPHRGIPTCKGCVCPTPTAPGQSGDRQRREKALPFLKEEKSEHERART